MRGADVLVAGAGLGTVAAAVADVADVARGTFVATVAVAGVGPVTGSAGEGWANGTATAGVLAAAVGNGMADTIGRGGLAVADNCVAGAVVVAGAGRMGDVSPVGSMTAAAVGTGTADGWGRVVIAIGATVEPSRGATAAGVPWVPGCGVVVVEMGAVATPVAAVGTDAEAADTGA